MGIQNGDSRMQKLAANPTNIEKITHNDHGNNDTNLRPLYIINETASPNVTQLFDDICNKQNDQRYAKPQNYETMNPSTIHKCLC